MRAAHRLRTGGMRAAHGLHAGCAQAACSLCAEHMQPVGSPHAAHAQPACSLCVARMQPVRSLRVSSVCAFTECNARAQTVRSRIKPARTRWLKDRKAMNFPTVPPPACPPRARARGRRMGAERAPGAGCYVQFTPFASAPRTVWGPPTQSPRGGARARPALCLSLIHI